MTAPTPEQIAAALKTVEIYKKRDPVAFTRANFFQQRLYRAVRDPKPESLTVVLAPKPNRVGGSHGLMQILSAIVNGTENPLFQGSPFGEAWPFLKSFRLFSTSENLADVGALQLALKAAMPPGKYEQSRGVGKGYNSAFHGPHGWTGDMFSFGQDALTSAGANKGLILGSEPMPHPLFVEGITRLSGNGLIILEYVQMDLAPYLEQLAEESGSKPAPLELYREVNGKRVPCADPMPDGLRFGTLKLDGRAVGEVRIVRGDVEDACREHSNGHMAHSAIEAMVAGWPEEEREARSKGKPLRLSGRIYPNWNDDNELEELPEYHADCWRKGDVRIANILDPADARPWALAWFAIFPNEDVICFAEWPNFDFGACKQSPVTDLEDYRGVIREAEAAIGRPVDMRYIDPFFGNAPGKGNARTLRTMLAAPCRACMAKARRSLAQPTDDPFNDVDESPEVIARAARECEHRIDYAPSLGYPGSVNDRHILVRAAIGGNGVRPKAYAMAVCQNMCRGMRRYAHKIEKNPERAVLERPSLIYSDFPTLFGYGYLKRFEKWPVEGDAPSPPRPAAPFKPRAAPIERVVAPRTRVKSAPVVVRPDRAVYDPQGDGRPNA